MKSPKSDSRSSLYVSDALTAAYPWIHDFDFFPFLILSTFV